MELGAIFSRNDLDQDGHLTKQELLSGLAFDGELRAALGIDAASFHPGTCEHDRAAALFDEMDTGHSGAVELEEFEAFCSGLSTSAQPTVMIQPTNPRPASVDKSGPSPPQAVEQVTQGREQRQTVNKNMRQYVFSRIFKRNDLDEDGHLTQEELMSSLAFDGELRTALGLKGLGFDPDSEDCKLALSVFQQVDTNGNGMVEEKEFLQFCSQLRLERARPLSPKPQFSETSSEPGYGSRWDVGSLYAELDNAIVEANQLNEMRKPAAERSQKWVLESKAKRKEDAALFKAHMAEQRKKREDAESAYMERLEREDAERIAARKAEAELKAAQEAAKTARAESAWKALREIDMKRQAEFWQHSHKMKEHAKSAKEGSQAMRTVQRDTLKRRPRRLKI
eukprot:TRINITY_DN1931_c0_g1_i6.p1 TRINITY_DN1931_c0_g1~~TRINITY_DN1931_c0_g1_i6.p1  ORF type:complete len:395 (-),score=129.04 TRINITY_DN1931_c0_g1_i6:299-1483(-)